MRVSGDQGRKLLWLGFLAAVSAIALAAEAPANPSAASAAPASDQNAPPPHPLHRVADRWTPYDAPTPPEGSTVHVVVAGDCLWNLAKQYYGDPYLWPTIWDSNRYVTYSHWIYPGDPLVIPPKPNLVAGNKEPAAGGAASGETEAAAEETADAAPMAAAEASSAEASAPPAAAKPNGPAEPVLVPAAEKEEIACAGMLYDHFDPSPLRIAGREEEQKELLGQQDIVYLSAGKDMGIQAGSEYSILRWAGTVKHPKNKKSSEVFIQRVGRLRVLTVQANSSTAEITLSCDSVLKGDYLIPYREVPVPMVERTSLAKIDLGIASRMSGTVMVVHDDPKALVAGAGDLIQIDLGTHAGLTAGDKVLFWHQQEGNVNRELGAFGVVLASNAGGSTVKVLASREEIRIGDPVDVR